MSHTPTPDQPEALAYVALGSNLGDRLSQMQQAVRQLEAIQGVEVISASPVYEAPAHTRPPGDAQPDYLNAVIEIRTFLPPHALLNACLRIERALGRTRDKEWSPRTIDLDLLVFDQASIDEEGLQVPHPRMADRRFVLQPLHDIAPDLTIPAPHNASVYSLLQRTQDPDRLRRYPRELTLAR